MRIGVMSDTHDRLGGIDLAFAFFSGQELDMVVHCGDWAKPDTARYLAERAAKSRLPVRGVMGNNDLEIESFLRYAVSAPGDFEMYQSTYSLILSAGKRLIALHGHKKCLLRNIMESDQQQIVLLGHSHRPSIVKNENQLIVNPGSTAFSIPRSRRWQPSVATIDTETMTAETHYLGTRNKSR